MYYDSILELIGNTPLVKMNKLNPNKNITLLAKLEFLNPGGSVKDRIGVEMIKKAKSDDKIEKGDTIIEPTSGNTGTGLALIAALEGYDTVFVMPDKMSDEKRNLLRAYGAKVVVTPTAVDPEDERSYYKVSDRLTKEIKNSYKPDQYHNQANPEAHYKTTGPEIWEQTEGKITHFVCGMGTGGTITGIAKFLKEKNPDIRIVGVDPIGSVFYKKFKEGDYDSSDVKPYKVEGVGEDFIPSTIDLSLIDEIIQVGDKESFLKTRELAKKEGILAGGSSGMALFAAQKIVKNINEGLVVVLFPDSGKSYLSKIFNDDWMRDNGFLDKSTAGDTIGEVLHSKKSPALISIQSNKSVKRSIEKMKKHDISQLLITSKGKVVGKVNERELLTGLFEGLIGPTNKISTAMNKKVLKIKEGDSVDYASKLLAEDNLLVVINDKKKPIGVVTRIDLIEYYS